MSNWQGHCFNIISDTPDPLIQSISANGFFGQSTLTILQIFVFKTIFQSLCKLTLPRRQVPELRSVLCLCLIAIIAVLVYTSIKACFHTAALNTCLQEIHYSRDISSCQSQYGRASKTCTVLAYFMEENLINLIYAFLETSFYFYPILRSAIRFQWHTIARNSFATYAVLFSCKHHRTVAYVFDIAE